MVAKVTTYPTLKHLVDSIIVGALGKIYENFLLDSNLVWNSLGNINFW
jgi:hypothetical protein